MKGRFFHLLAVTHLLLAVTATAAATAAAAEADETKDAAATSGSYEGVNQYKRVHQKALSQITGGNAERAVATMNDFVEKYPYDAEAHFMLTVAYAQLGEKEKALASMDKALELGLPPGRLHAGPRDLLEPISNTQAMRLLGDTRESGWAKRHQIVHGPMVGDVTHQSAKFWVRTSGQRVVNVYVWKAEEERQTAPRNTKRTREEDDFTTVVEVGELEPDTEYKYNVLVANTKNRLDARGGTFRTSPPPGSPVKFRLAFGGGAGYVPPNERVWTTIKSFEPRLLMLLGDNVYIDDPQSTHMQRYCYYRRFSRPEWRELVAVTPLYSIWDDHDFGTDDSWGGPEIDQPAWKPSVWKIFTENWVNPAYGGGEKQPGVWYDFSVGDVHFIMLDGRYYRTDAGRRGGEGVENPSMLGPVQKQWLKETLAASEGTFKVLVSPVPWDFRTKPGRAGLDTWRGYAEEREEIFSFVEENGIGGVVLMSADRHRSDAWKIERENGYDLYEFNSSRLTNQHVHGEMKDAIFSYNKKQSFGLVEFDTTVDDPTVVYRVITIDGEEVHRLPLVRSQLE